MAKAKQYINQLIPNEIIVNKIYIIREVKVMLDKDLADMYGVETRVFNQTVKRNFERFPEDFMFQLSQKEFQHLISQSATSSFYNIDNQDNTTMISQSVISSLNKRKRSSLPYAFTEQGVAMLSGVINSSKAIAMNIAIMRAFVETRRASATNKLFAEKFKQIEDKIGTHDSQFAQIYEAIENMLDDKVEKESLPKNRKRIGFRPNE
jgi:DNA-binding transcriptional regulator YiaG